MPLAVHGVVGRASIETLLRRGDAGGALGRHLASRIRPNVGGDKPEEQVRTEIKRSTGHKVNKSSEVYKFIGHKVTNIRSQSR